MSIELLQKNNVSAHITVHLCIITEVTLNNTLNTIPKSPFSTDRTGTQRNHIVWLRTAQPGSSSKARAGPRPLDSQAKALISGPQHGKQFLPKERDEDVMSCLS